MLYPLLEQYDIDCKRAIAYGFSRTEAGFELKKELPDAGLYAIFVIAEKSFEVNVFDAYTDEEYFNTRKYDGFIMPAGEYSTLKIVIGSGEGHNWWCVMYPSVCISGCTDDFDEIMNDEEKEMLTSSKFVPKFKIIELYESIKNKIIS